MMPNRLTMDSDEDMDIEVFAVRSKAIGKYIQVEISSGNWPNGLDIEVFLTSDQATDLRELLTYALAAIPDNSGHFDNQAGMRYRLHQIDKRSGAPVPATATDPPGRPEA